MPFSPPPPHTLAECLPQHAKVFQFLGIQDPIEAAGFFRTAGNTVWWGKSGRRVEPYPEGRGYQVLRRDFDRVLLDLAQSAGARVHGPGDSPKARFTLDCSGRAGVIARAYRVKPKNTRTVALCGVWRNGGGWKLPDASHTLVEAYGDGWAGRAALLIGRPLPSPVGRDEAGPGQRPGRAYLAEMAKTRSFLESSRVPGSNPGRGLRCFAVFIAAILRARFLLAGGAGSFIDPLSSFGVKKPWCHMGGAVVANTCLRRPRCKTALGFPDGGVPGFGQHDR